MMTVCSSSQSVETAPSETVEFPRRVKVRDNLFKLLDESFRELNINMVADLIDIIIEYQSKHWIESIGDISIETVSLEIGGDDICKSTGCFLEMMEMFTSHSTCDKLPGDEP